MVPHLGLGVCLCVHVCFASLLLSPAATERGPVRMHTHKHTLTHVIPILLPIRVLIRCLSRTKCLPFPFPNTHSHRHTHKITPPLPLQCLHPIAPILNDPKIAQEAIRKNTAKGGGSGRVLQSTAIGGYQASPSLLFCLFLLSSIPLPAALCSHESLL